jgi:predicted nuclease of restriction endonuclease-like RecB superfamily
LLTADLVRPTTRKGVMHVRALKGDKRARALEHAALLIDAARQSVGKTRAELAARGPEEVPAKERILVAGLRKLVDDKCTWETDEDTDPPALRRAVFLAAAAARRELGPGAPFLRDEVLTKVAADEGLPADALDAALYADLKEAQRLIAVDVGDAEELIDRYDLAQAQAVLLRAARLTARVHCERPEAYRRLFHRLKFQRLLFTLEHEDDGGYRLVIDGPFSLFSQSTRYGLQLALALPHLAACDRCEIEAEVRWGKRRERRTFLWSKADAPRSLPPPEEAEPREDVARLVKAFSDKDYGWRAEATAAVLHLPGAGLCVPDVCFVHEETGEVVFLEVMGFWSRDAVWKRVELVESGLEERVLFAVSSRLRVSERALDDEETSGLYVYKGVMSAARVAERLEGLRSR